MPWTETDRKEQRIRLILEASSGDGLNVAELCRLFGVSRKTAYKWLGRYRESGAAGLDDRSSAPVSHPQAVVEEVRERLLALRRAHASWGPRKLLAFLERHCPGTDWPAASTVGELLKRAGLVSPRRRRRRSPPFTQPFAACERPNDEWCIDFKGQFPVGNRLCYPLTISDAYSRYLLCCQGMAHTGGAGVRQVMERIFRDYGLPAAIRSDNGAPFAGVGAGGLSRLSVWWVRLGILPERIEPGEPQQNGRHERMHLTLEIEATTPRQRTLRGQQRVLDAWRDEYNGIRPHEALAMKTPMDVYRPSPRPFPSVLPELQYPDGYELRRVRHDATMKWRHSYVYVSQSLVGEVVGLRPEEQGLWSVFFGPIWLGKVHDAALHLGLVRPRRRQWKTEREDGGASPR